MKAPRGSALIGQSGGPTCVINQSLVGIVEAARAAQQITNVYGALHGIKGVLEGRLIDLGRESKETLEAVARTPCAALRSVRKKPTREECEQILADLAHDLRLVWRGARQANRATLELLMRKSRRFVRFDVRAQQNAVRPRVLGAPVEISCHPIDVNEQRRRL